MPPVRAKPRGAMDRNSSAAAVHAALRKLGQGTEVAATARGGGTYQGPCLAPPASTCCHAAATHSRRHTLRCQIVQRSLGCMLHIIGQLW